MRYVLLGLALAALVGCSDHCEPRYVTITTQTSPNEYSIHAIYIDEHCDTFPVPVFRYSPPQ